MFFLLLAMFIVYLFFKKPALSNFSQGCEKSDKKIAPFMNIRYFNPRFTHSLLNFNQN